MERVLGESKSCQDPPSMPTMYNTYVHKGTATLNFSKQFLNTQSEDVHFVESFHHIAFVRFITKMALVSTIRVLYSIWALKDNCTWNSSEMPSLFELNDSQQFVI